MIWVGASNFLYWNSTTNVIILRAGAFGRWWSHEGFFILNGISAFIKETWRICFSVCHLRKHLDYGVLREEGRTRWLVELINLSHPSSVAAWVAAPPCLIPVSWWCASWEATDYSSVILGEGTATYLGDPAHSFGCWLMPALALADVGIWGSELVSGSYEKLKNRMEQILDHESYCSLIMNFPVYSVISSKLLLGPNH